MGRPLQGKQARHIALREFLTVEPQTVVADAVRQMAESNKGGCVVLSAIGDMVGMFTERDLMRRVVAKRQDPAQLKVEQVMTPDVVCAQADDDAWELLRVMLEANFRHLPVMDGRKLIGMISLKEFCRSMLKEGV